MHDEIKIIRTKELISRIEEGFDVPKKDLSRVLTDTEMQNLDANWKAEKRYKIEKPSEIKKYEKLLRIADLHFCRYESMHSKKHDEFKTRKMFHLAEKKMEAAIQYAIEITSDKPDLRLWFDREIKFEYCQDMNSMPRIVTSRSFQNAGDIKNITGRQTKRELKLKALHEALEKLEPQDSTYNLLELIQAPIKVNDFSDFKF